MYWSNVAITRYYSEAAQVDSCSMPVPWIQEFEDTHVSFQKIF